MLSTSTLLGIIMWKKIVLWNWKLLETNVWSMKSCYQSCMTVWNGVLSVYWPLWDMVVLICRDSYETLVKLHIC